MQLKRSTLVAFTSPALPLAAIGMPLIVYLPPYYAGTLGLPLATVGLIFFLVRVIDLPFDPLFGQLMDNTKSRFGRYRLWAIGGALVLTLGAFLVFMAEPGIGATRAFFQLLLMYLGYSALIVAHYGWAASLSRDYHERSRLFGWVQAGHVLGMILVLSLPPLVARATGDDGAAPGIQAMGWFVVAMAPLTALLAAATAPEYPAAAVRDKPTLADFKALAKNPLVRRLLAIDALVGIAPGITGAMFIFYFEHRLGFSAAEASLLLLFYFVAGFAAAPLWVRLAKRLGKHRAMATAMLAYCATHGALSMLPVGGFNDAIFGMLIAGIPYTALYFFPRAMLADVGDVDRLETGLDRNALLQAVLTTTSKLAHAVPVAVVYPVLGLIGFNPTPGAANTPEAILGMTLLFVLGPITLILGTAWLVARWPHDEKAHADVQAALAERAAVRPAE
jgi:glycoside/pentoside/hexuronide:cation symporter, GPH family